MNYLSTVYSKTVASCRKFLCRVISETVLGYCVAWEAEVWALRTLLSQFVELVAMPRSVE